MQSSTLSNKPLKGHQASLARRIILKASNGTHKIFEVRDKQWLSMASPMRHLELIKIEGFGINDMMDNEKYCDFF